MATDDPGCLIKGTTFARSGDDDNGYYSNRATRVLAM